VTTGFGTLRDHDVGTVILEPARFIHGGRRRQHHSAPRFDAVDQIRRRQPEVETDDRRGELAQQIRQRRIERPASAPLRNTVGIDRVFAIVRCEAVAPGRFSCRIRTGWRMARSN